MGYGGQPIRPLGLDVAHDVVLLVFPDGRHRVASGNPAIPAEQRRLRQHV
jgi:hypothetical protein